MYEQLRFFRAKRRIPRLGVEDYINVCAKGFHYIRRFGVSGLGITNEGIMEVAVKRPVVVRVRLSDWVDRRKLTVRINQQPADCHLSGAWLYLSGLKQGDRVEIGIPMTVIRQDYEFRSEVFSFRWKGDAVDAVASEGKRLCFFDAL